MKSYKEESKGIWVSCHALGWGKVQVSIYTHAVNGLTMNDFILAAKFDKIV